MPDMLGKFDMKSETLSEGEVAHCSSHAALISCDGQIP